MQLVHNWTIIVARFEPSWFCKVALAATRSWRERERAGVGVGRGTALDSIRTRTEKRPWRREIGQPNKQHMSNPMVTKSSVQTQQNTPGLQRYLALSFIFCLYNEPSI